ncbi:MAG: molecular chaperone HtpG, partial [Muribaculaceae bacterium]|nr:molecular chaperone HtpG [Muribaculaceae bacterium]
DVPFVGLLEQKNEKSRCVRVDSDVVDRLIVKEDAQETQLSQEEKDLATGLFESQVPAIDKCNFTVAFAALNENDMPVVITQSEYMRRMKEMAQFQPGMSFYGDFPDSYALTLNTNHRLIKDAIDRAQNALDSTLKPIVEEIEVTNNVINALRSLDKDGKGVPEDKKQDLKDNEDRLAQLRSKKTEAIKQYAATDDKVKQLIDIALLSNGLLKGEGLSTFLHRSVNLL